MRPLVAYAVQRFRDSSRGPYKTDQAIVDAKQADLNSTQRIIVDKSELALRAYLNAKRAIESKHGFAGQADLARLLRSLSTQPIEQQHAFAADLALAIESEVPQSTESDGSNNIGKRTKRSRTCTNLTPVFASNAVRHHRKFCASRLQPALQLMERTST